MYNQLTSIMFFCMVLILTVFDTRRLESVVSPFTVTAWPFVGISLLVNFYLINIGFTPVTIRVQLFILLHLLILWFIGYISYFIFRPQDGRNVSLNMIYDYSEPFIYISKYQPLIVIISWISIAIVLVKVKSLFGSHGGFQYLGDPQFEKEMIVGLVAHITQLEKICFLFLFFSFKYSKFKFITLITIIGLIVAIIAIQVKYHLIWILVMAFLFSVIQKPIQKQIKMTVFIVISMVIIMNLFWILLTLAWGTFSFESEGIREYLTKQTFNYISSSPIVLDGWLSHPNVKPEWTMIIVLKNVVNVIIGNKYRFTANNLVNLSFSEVARGISSNTGTAFGVYYIIGGIIFSLFMISLLSVISYYFYYSSRKNNNVLFVYLNIQLLTILLLTFFGDYLTLLSLYEMVTFFCMFVIVFRIFDIIKATSYLNIKKY